MSIETALYRRYVASKRKQARGAALAISLLLLVVMTILGIAASQITRMQAQSATNARDRDIALQRAEAGLRAAERWLDRIDLIAPPLPCGFERCRVYAAAGIEQQAIRNPLAAENDGWWQRYGWEYVATEGDSGASDSAMNPPPRFVIEEHAEVLDTLTISPTGPPARRIVYQISASAEAGEARSIAVLQSRFARRFE